MPIVNSAAIRGVGAQLRELMPQPEDWNDLRESWRGDLLAGITVGLVALPLALGFGVVSGVGAAAGLVTAIVAGLIAALLGGSNLQVSGPTGAMTVVLVPVVAEHGTAAVPLVAVLAGLLVVAAGMLGLGRSVTLLPWPLVEGFTVGIAAIIFLQQLPLLLDTAPVTGDGTVHAAARSLIDADVDSATGPVALALLVVITILGLHHLRPRWPVSLVAVALATLCSELTGLDAPTITALPTSLPMPALPDASLGTINALLSAALAVAVLAALESLLSARVADGMTTDSTTHPDRELFGQGIANVASGLFGGLPATGAIARTAVNVRAGARTRLAAATHAVVLLAVLLIGSDVVEHIPLAALAGVLMVTAVRMVERGNVRAILHASRSDALVLIGTCVTTIAFDLILAVEVGLALAAVLALRTLARASQVTREPVRLSASGAITQPDHGERVHDSDIRALLAEHVVVYRLDGALFFGAAHRLLDELADVGRAEVVVLRLGFVQLLDATGAQALADLVADLERRDIDVLLCGLQDRHRTVLEAIAQIARLRREGRVFDDLDDAIAHAHQLVTERKQSG